MDNLRPSHPNDRDDSHAFRFGVMRVFGMETRNLRSSYVTATASSGPVISEELTGLPHTAVEGTTIEAYGRRSMRKLHGTKQKLCSGNKWILLLT